jgi:sigma-E factor negative regulatory protein RseC
MQYYEPHTDCTTDTIRHSGKVTGVSSDHYMISITTESACSACSVKGMCNVSNMKEEVLEIQREPDSNYSVGDAVDVVMEKSLGPKAVLLGYVVPFLLLFTTLIISLNLLNNEGLAGLISVLIVVPYYLLLYAFRNRLKKTFVFRIRS